MNHPGIYLMRFSILSISEEFSMARRMERKSGYVKMTCPHCHKELSIHVRAGKRRKPRGESKSEE